MFSVLQEMYFFKVSSSKIFAVNNFKKGSRGGYHLIIANLFDCSTFHL